MRLLNTIRLLMLILAFNSSHAFAQGNYDVRKSKWGMTLENVLKSESISNPIVGTRSFKEYGGNLVKEDDLTYDSINIGDGLIGKLEYIFNNKHLSEIRFRIYGNSSYNKANKNNVISFLDKVNFTKFIFESLREKEYICNYGWFFRNKELSDCTILGNTVGYSNNCSLDEKTLNELSDVGKNCFKTAPSIALKNKRTDIVITYNEWQNSPERWNFEDENTYDSFYNTICWLSYTPTSETLKELNKDTF